MRQPKIFYFCYDHQKPTGGQKTVYKHVDILNKHGYQAFVLHIKKDFRLTWFDNETKVICFDEFKRIYHPDRDFLVLPEDMGSKILSFPGQKVIFNQNCYYGFYCFGFQKPPSYPYLHPDVKGVLVASKQNKEYLSFAYPGLEIHRIYNSIDPDKFTYQPIRNKKKMIACPPAKNPMDLSQIYHILLSRSEQALNVLKNYQWSFIENRTETEVATILSDALLFIFLSTEEGFGRMPLEAMFSGSLVLAYNSGPMTEYLCPDHSFLSAKGDVLAMVKHIEEITQCFPENVDKLQAMSEAAFKTASQYSVQREEESVITTWGKILVSGE